MGYCGSSTLLLLLFSRVVSLNVTTLMGSLADSFALDTPLRGAVSVAVDVRRGDLYIAGGSVIWKMPLSPGTPPNLPAPLTVIVGTGADGYSADTLLAASASITSVLYIAWDDATNALYFPESGQGKLRRVINGALQTFAGSTAGGSSTGDGTAATAASFNGLRSVASDGNGTFYVSDGTRIRVINTTRFINAYAGGTTCGFGQGAGTSAALCQPMQLAFNYSDRSLYFADTSINRIRKVQSDTVVVSVVGNGSAAGSAVDNAYGVSSALNNPSGVAVAGANLYFTDARNNKVWCLLPNGRITVVANSGGLSGFSGDGGLAVNALLNNPLGLAYYNMTATLYVVDNGNNRVRKITNRTIATVAGTDYQASNKYPRAAATSTLNGPWGVAFAPYTGTTYIADTANHIIVAILVNGTAVSVAGTVATTTFMSGLLGDGGPATSATLNSPKNVEYDEQNGRLFIADTSNHRVRMVQGGIMSTIAGDGTGMFYGDGLLAAVASLYYPTDIAWAPMTNLLYIADSNNARIRAVNLSSGIIFTVAGNGGYCTYVEDIPALSCITSALGVAVHPNTGALYFTEGTYIRTITAAGRLQTVAGNASAPFVMSGWARSMTFNQFRDVTFDTFTDSMIFSFSGQPYLSRMDAAGYVTPITGTALGFSGDGGDALQATFFGPKRCAVDPQSGAVLVVDAFAHRLRLLYPTSFGTVTSLSLIINATTNSSSARITPPIVTANYTLLAFIGTGFYSVSSVAVGGIRCAWFRVYNWTYMEGNCSVTLDWSVQVNSTILSTKSYPTFVSFMPVPPITISTVNLSASLVVTARGIASAGISDLYLLDATGLAGTVFSVMSTNAAASQASFASVALSEALLNTANVTLLMIFSARSSLKLPAGFIPLQIVRPALKFVSVPVTSKVEATSVQVQLPLPTVVSSYVFGYPIINNVVSRAWIGNQSVTCTGATTLSPIKIWCSIPIDAALKSRLTLEQFGLLNVTSDGAEFNAPLDANFSGDKYIIQPVFTSMTPSRIATYQATPNTTDIIISTSDTTLFSGLMDSLMLQLLGHPIPCGRSIILNGSALMCEAWPISTAMHFIALSADQVPSAWMATLYMVSKSVSILTPMTVTFYRRPSITGAYPSRASPGASVAIVGKYLYPTVPAPRVVFAGSIECEDAYSTEDWIICRLPAAVPATLPGFPDLSVSVITSFDSLAPETLVITIPTDIAVSWYDAAPALQAHVNGTMMLAQAVALPSGAASVYSLSVPWRIASTGGGPITCWLSVPSSGVTQACTPQVIVAPSLEAVSYGSVSVSVQGTSTLTAAGDNVTVSFNQVGVSSRSDCVVQLTGTCRDVLGHVASAGVTRAVYIPRMQLQWTSAAALISLPTSINAGVITAVLNISSVSSVPAFDALASLLCVVGIAATPNIPAAESLLTSRSLLSTTTLISPTTTYIGSTTLVAIEWNTLDASACNFGGSYFIHGECAWTASGERFRLPTRDLTIYNVTLKMNVNNVLSTSPGPLRVQGYLPFTLTGQLFISSPLDFSTADGACSTFMYNSSTAKLSTTSLGRIFAVSFNGSFTSTPLIMEGLPGKRGWVYVSCVIWGIEYASLPLAVELVDYYVASNYTGNAMWLWPSAKDATAAYATSAHSSLTAPAHASLSCTASIRATTTPATSLVYGVPTSLSGASALVGVTTAYTPANDEMVSLLMPSLSVYTSFNATTNVSMTCRDGAGRSASLPYEVVLRSVQLSTQWLSVCPCSGIPPAPLDAFNFSIQPNPLIEHAPAITGLLTTNASSAALIAAASAWWSCAAGIFEDSSQPSMSASLVLSSAVHAVGSLSVVPTSTNNSWVVTVQGLSCSSCRLGASYLLVAECVYVPTGVRIRPPVQHLTVANTSVILGVPIIVPAYVWQTSIVTVHATQAAHSSEPAPTCTLQTSSASSAQISVRTRVSPIMVIGSNTSTSFDWIVEGPPLASVGFRMDCLLWSAQISSSQVSTVTLAPFLVEFASTTDTAIVTTTMPSSSASTLPLVPPVSVLVSAEGAVSCVLEVANATCGSASLVGDALVQSTGVISSSTSTIIKYGSIGVSASSACAIDLVASCSDAVGRVNVTSMPLRVTVPAWALRWDASLLGWMNAVSPPVLPLSVLPVLSLTLSSQNASDNYTSLWTCDAAVVVASTTTVGATFDVISRNAASVASGVLTLLPGAGWTLDFDGLSVSAGLLATTYMLYTECSWGPTGERVIAADMPVFNSPALAAVIQFSSVQLLVRAYTPTNITFTIQGLEQIQSAPLVTCTAVSFQSTGRLTFSASTWQSPSQWNSSTTMGTVTLVAEAQPLTDFLLQLTCSAWGQAFSSQPQFVSVLSYKVLTVSIPSSFVPCDATLFWPTPASLIVQVLDALDAPVTDAVCSAAVNGALAVQLIIQDGAPLPAALADTDGYVAFPPFGIQTGLDMPYVILIVSCARATGDGAAPLSLNLTTMHARVIPCTPPAGQSAAQTALPAFAVGLTSSIDSHSCDALALDLAIPEATCSIALAGGTGNAGSVFLAGATAVVDLSTLIAVFDSFVVTAVRGITYNFTISCLIGNVAVPNAYRFSVAIEGCAAGTQPSGVFCNKCGSSLFSMGGPQSECIGCPNAGADCSGGIIKLLPNYYRAPNEAALAFGPGTELFPCLNGEACVVNASTMTYGCLRGYTGPLCSVCDSSINYAKFTDACRECWDDSVSNFLVALAALAITALLTVVALRKSTQRSDASIALRITMSYIQAIGSLRVFRAGGTKAYRDLMGWTEVISASPLSVSALQCIWRPPYLLQFIVTIALPLLAAVSVITIFVVVTLLKACATSGMKRNAATDSHATLIPNGQAQNRLASQIVAHTRCGRISSAFRSGLSHWWEEQRHLSTLLFVLFLAYMPITSASLRTLDCYPHTIGGVTYLRNDMRVECYVGQHAVAQTIAYLILILIGIGYPVGLWLLLSTVRSSTVRSEKFHNTWGFMYDGYRGGEPMQNVRKSLAAVSRSSLLAPRNSILAFGAGGGGHSRPCGACRSACNFVVAIANGRLLWWESVVLIRKAGIVLLAVLVSNPYLQNVGASLWLLLFFALQLKLQPYTKRLFNILEMWSLGAALATATISTTLLQFDVADPSFISQSANDMTPLQWAITVLLVIINFSAIILLAGTWFFLQCRRAREVATRAQLGNKLGLARLRSVKSQSPRVNYSPSFTVENPIAAKDAQSPQDAAAARRSSLRRPSRIPPVLPVRRVMLESRASFATSPTGSGQSVSQQQQQQQQRSSLAYRKSIVPRASMMPTPTSAMQPPSKAVNSDTVASVAARQVAAVSRQSVISPTTSFASNARSASPLKPTMARVRTRGDK